MSRKVALAAIRAEHHGNSGQLQSHRRDIWQQVAADHVNYAAANPEQADASLGPDDKKARNGAKNRVHKNKYAGQKPKA